MMPRFRKHSIEEKRRRTKVRKQRKKFNRKFQKTVAGKRKTEISDREETTRPDQNESQEEVTVRKPQVQVECPSSSFDETQVGNVPFAESSCSDKVCRIEN